ncbi:acyl-CoA dehydrogenase [Mycolicibacterium pulveris]|nr:acyl-CoA dehydrogenase [Mycolicibacterium pulveris]
MIEDAVSRLFTEIAGVGHAPIAARLARLGWADIEATYPDRACQLLFDAQGRMLTHTDCLHQVMLAELTGRLDEPVDGLVLPGPSDSCAPASQDGQIRGVVIGPPAGVLVVPVAGADGVSLGVVDADDLQTAALNTFDPSVCWHLVSGQLAGPLVDATKEWPLAVAAAHRALATELVAISDEILCIAIEHAKVRIQFGMAIGSFQSVRHALAEVAAKLEGVRALVGESWRHRDRLIAQAAKAAAGRAHRAVSETAMQVCGAIGLTDEHDLHRYVARGIQVDALCGSHRQLEEAVAERVFADGATGTGLPPAVTWDGG